MAHSLGCVPFFFMEEIFGIWVALKSRENSDKNKLPFLRIIGIEEKENINC